jgi:hypothetical protein
MKIMWYGSNICSDLQKLYHELRHGLNILSISWRLWITEKSKWICMIQTRVSRPKRINCSNWAAKYWNVIK